MGEAFSSLIALTITWPSRLKTGSRLNRPTVKVNLAMASLIGQINKARSTEAKGPAAAKKMRFLAGMDANSGISQRPELGIRPNCNLPRRSFGPQPTMILPTFTSLSLAAR